MKKEHTTIGIVTVPILQASVIPLSNLVNIFYSLSDEIHLITGSVGYTLLMKNKKVHTYQVEHRAGTNVFTRAINYVWTQLKISWKLMSLTKNVDFWFLFVGGENLVLPILTAKLLGKDVIIVSVGYGLKECQIKRDPFIKIVVFLQSITYRLSNKIILYSPGLIEKWNLEKYRHKISIAHEHFINLDKFKIQKPLNDRDNLIGYIGRLSEEKGTLNFVKAIPQIIKENDGLQFLIGGDGLLRDEIEKYLRNENLNNKVKLAGWISRDQLSDYMNKLKLIILPSYTEGLPNIMLEAMACGTPVLATPVGAIPDVIQDGKTGFIMENNSPECIARTIIRALNHSSLEQIVMNARALVETEFTYEKAVERYRKILEDL